MAVQRDIAVPDDVEDQIELYKVYLENHSQQNLMMKWVNVRYWIHWLVIICLV